MANMNKVILIGNLTRDPEVRYIPSGKAVADIGLALNRSWTDRQSGQRHEETTFVEVTLWDRQAEVAGEYLSKGSSVLIEGRLHLDSWDDKETGQKRSKLKVVGEWMQMLGSRGDGGGGSGGGGGGYRSQQPPQQQAAAGEPPSAGEPPAAPPPDDDVPF